MSLTISKLRLLNFKPFRGEQVLELEPKHYAIVARHQDDADRSNYLGKSSLEEAIDYCLTGRLPASCRRKVDWIHRGQKAGEVELGLSDGARVVRTLATNASEKVWYFPPGGEPMVQDRAEEAIERAMGLTREDLTATCYFQQREMARLVLCDPAERMKMVSGWLRLEALQRCESLAHDELVVIAGEVEALRRQVQACDQAIAGALEQTLSKDADELKSKIVEAGGEGEIAHHVLEEATAKHESNVRRRQLMQQMGEYDELVARGKALAAKVAATDRAALEAAVASTQAKMNAVTSEHGVASAVLIDRRTIAKDGFDGACPLAGKPCPAKSFVEQEVRENKRVLQVAQEREARALREHDAACQAWRNAHEDLKAHDRDVEQLKWMREQVRRLKVAKEQVDQLQPGDEVGDAAAMAEAREAWLAARLRGQKFADALELIDVKERERDKLKELVAAKERVQREASAAAAIFGKQGAQRRVAEVALEEIEARANALLGECGIGLSVKVEWGRDGTGLAATCANCGAAHPKSERVKACQRCGEERGPNVISKLEIVPSERSGAADDLAGATVQLAASAWLREDRSSSWGVAMLDEVFAQLDRANRLAFSTALPRMLAITGFQQSFVISHSRDAEAAFPGRIEITSDGRVSTARVAV